MCADRLENDTSIIIKVGTEILTQSQQEKIIRTAHSRGDHAGMMVAAMVNIGIACFWRVDGLQCRKYCQLAVTEWQEWQPMKGRVFCFAELIGKGSMKKRIRGFMRHNSLLFCAVSSMADLLLYSVVEKRIPILDEIAANDSEFQSHRLFWNEVGSNQQEQRQYTIGNASKGHEGFERDSGAENESFGDITYNRKGTSWSRGC